MSRISADSIERNRKLQRERNARNNPRRPRNEFGRLYSDASHLEHRPFIGWDGEGYRSFEVGSDGHTEILHHYMLFGASTGHYETSRDLGTKQCLDLILYVEQLFPDAYHVGFAFEYDVNMILKDLPWRMLAMLHDVGAVIWNGYRIKHTPHKMFSVSKNGISATIYDVFGFFHTSYLRALRKFSIGTGEQLSKIEAGKNNRSRFTYSEIAAVISYWSEEISLLPSLMDCLRDSCYTAGFYITRWHGPGALASFALRKYGVREWKPKKDVPKSVQVARRLAYAGGRFQLWRCGIWDYPAYTADINSAYAYAISLLPRLDNREWKRGDTKAIRSARDIAHFALYRIRFDATELEAQARTSAIPFPLFNRDRKGNLTWPARTEGWFWSPEAALVAGSKHATFLECWIFDDDGTRPFDFVRTAYDRRLELQRSNNPAEKAYKWFLASIYGQFAQRVGWNRHTRKAPASHQLEWAGFITSFCRALVYRAALDVSKRGGLISIDTDGVTSSVPFNNDYLPGGVGTALGEWKLEIFDKGIFWQNGIYWLQDNNGEWQDPKTRGMPRGSVDRDRVESVLRAHRWSRTSGNPTIAASRQRFCGYRRALANQFDHWRRWETEPVKIEFGGSGKGRHVPSLCMECTRDRIPDRRGNHESRELHTVTHLYPDDPLSQPHKLPWLEPVSREDYTDAVFLGIWGD